MTTKQIHLLEKIAIDVDAIKEDIAGMATKEDIVNMATKDDIANMATKDDIVNMATKDDITAIRIDMVTHEDLDQRFENHTEFIMQGMDQRFAEAADDRAEIRTIIDRIDQRDHEDITTLYHEVAQIKARQS